MELQSHEPTNAVYLNNHFLGYLPMKDWVYSWVSTSFSVPNHLLRPGYNALTVQAGYVAPQLQGLGFTWDDVLFRGISLERVTLGSSTLQNCSFAGAGGHFGVASQPSGEAITTSGLPRGSTAGQLVFGEVHPQHLGRNVYFDDIAILQQGDGSSSGCLRADVADARAARAPRKATVGDERHR